VRLLSVLLAAALLSFAARADEVDLSSRRRSGEPPRYVLRAEGGNEFAPFGYVGGVFSWLVESRSEIEIGAGGGFPGLQLGLAARRLFGDEGQYFLAELSLAGNTKVNRGLEQNSTLVNPQGAAASSSLWTLLGFGLEIRQDFYSLDLAGDIVFLTTSLTPHWAVHGGVGLGF